MPDELSGADRGSTPPAFDFDDDAISSLLDNFLETQTGTQEKHISRPPDPDDVGAQAAQRSVFQEASRHETLPLVGDDATAKQRRIALLDALAQRAVGSARARLLSSAAELHEQLGQASEAAERYREAQSADARDVVVLRALRRHAIRVEDWPAAVDALEKESGLPLGDAERAAALELLAQIQLTKLGDAAAAEQAATRATELRPDDFVAWMLVGAARVARGQRADAARALSAAAERWHSTEAQAVILTQAADLMEQANEPAEAMRLFERVIESQPHSLHARLGIVRAASLLRDVDLAIETLRTASEAQPVEVAAALRRYAAVLCRASGRLDDARGLLASNEDVVSAWTVAELEALSGDVQGAAATLAGSAPQVSDELEAFRLARISRLRSELGERHTQNGGHLPELRAYLASHHALLTHTDESPFFETLSSDGPELSALEVELPPIAAIEAQPARSRLDVLLQAYEASPDDPFIRRALALSDVDAARGARRWRDEADETVGARRAFALTISAELSDGGQSAAEAFEMALQSEPGYSPARWRLDESRSDEALQLPQLDRAVPDPLLLELLFEELGPSSREAGDLMALAARKLGQREYLLRAAAVFRASGHPGDAAKALREASAAAPGDVGLRVRRKDAELQAGEFARLADASMQRARDARDETEELGALAAMAEVDRLARRDMQSARLSLQSIAEKRPEHIPTARALEWDALREQDLERVRLSARRLLEALPAGTADRVARRRLMVELLKSDPGILQNEVDRMLRSFDDPLESDPGLARQVLGAAYAKNDADLGVRALIALQASVGGDLERATLALEAASLCQQGGDTARALESLNTAAAHPLALEAEARLLHASKRLEDAAAVYCEAAKVAKDGQRAASLWREAACVFEEQLGDPARALDAWIAASNADVRYLDVYRRLAASYQREEQHEELALLIDRRIDAGADTPTLVGLLLEKAEQRRSVGDIDGVLEALDECLELDPFHFAALQELVETHRAQEDWQGATEALIRIARLKRSTNEEVWAFCQLGEVYHEHLDDLPRAEASLRRALALAPAHTETVDRLASVLNHQNKPTDAARLLQQLVRAATGAAEARDYRIRLADAVERTGDARQAEAMLEQLRTEQPTEPDVILAIADQYARQGAGPAESMHLNRALNDLREAIDARPGDEALWTTLVRVLNRRHGPSAASCAASAAIAIGHPASLFEGDVTSRNEALGAPKLPLAPGVDNTVAPATLPGTVRRLFGLCEHAFDKMLPFDASAWRLKRPSGAHRGLVEEAGEVAEALGISEPRVRMTYIAPSACMPISGDPPTLVVGGNLHERTTPEERIFLFARTLKVAANHLAPALRARPEELDAALLALLQGHDPSRSRGGESQQLIDLRKKLIKAVPRRWRDEVESLVLELGGNSAFSTRLVPFAVSSLGDRVALTLTGDVPSAVDALLKAAGHDVPRGHAGRLEAICETPEAWALIRFAISDAHFEARAQAGVDP